MGSFFTNVHVRTTDVARVRAVVEARLVREGFAIADGPADREIILVPAGRWLAFYDVRAETQDDTIERWAKQLSGALETEAISVLVHDSDVLALALYACGTRRDAFDSNPAFSGKPPSKVTPAARAKKWAEVTLPDHSLAMAFASKHVFAEAALASVASAIGADAALLGTGYRYLTRDGDVPAGAIRIHAGYRTRPAWERRATGAPRFISQWTRHEMTAPPIQPVVARRGDELVRAHVMATNVGGPGRGLRLAIEQTGDSIELHHAEIVVTKPGRLQMNRHDAPLARAGAGYVVELPDVQLQPGYDGEPEDLIGASMDEMLDAHNAGQVYVNLTGRAMRRGTTKLAITLAPLTGEPHVERAVVEVR